MSRPLLSRIHTLPETINNIILACCVLHKFIRLEPISDETDSEDDCSSPVTQFPSTSSSAYDIREKIYDWCVTEDDVAFQHHMN